MRPINLTITVEAIHDNYIGCYISDLQESIRLCYYPEDSTLSINQENNLSRTLHNNKVQFEKVIRSAIKGKMTIGQTINCVFIEDFNFIQESDFSRYIRVDRRNGELAITTSDTGTEEIHKIYADGSHAAETGLSGFGGFTQDLSGKRATYNASFKEGSSNQMELMAVIKGLQLLELVEEIQINTDSRFVIRGLAQWVHFWRHNNWQTAYGCDVKFAKCWQQIDQLCDNKVIEMKWIKGHSGNAEQTFCHDLAKQATTVVKFK
ncbi:ribonuclease HI [Puteibacter caeruleilacunae]|nr:ribonuclease HI [Puteibacter caeruleilacunae]